MSTGPVPAPGAAVRVGLVVNPTAGRGRGARAAAGVHTALARAGMEVVELSGATMAEATARARAGLARGLRALVVVGGDGMVHLGANVVAGTAVPLGVVAVGSGNDVARHLRLPVHDVPAAVSLIDDALAPDRPGAGAVALDAVAVSRPGGPVQRWFLAVLSGGIDAAVTVRANTLTWPGGNARYVRALLGELGRMRPYGYRITADGQVWEGAATLVAVANTPSFGGGLRIAPQARTDDGLLDVVVAEAVSRTTLLRIFPSVYRGGHTGHPAVHLLRARSVLLEEQGTYGQPPPPAMADGEHVSTLPLQCDVHPGAVGVLARRLGP